MKEKYYITTAIAYTSRKPHIGNSYEIVLTDAIARYQRLLGKDVFFLTGTDEHGQKIEEIAQQEGMSPKQYVDKIAAGIRQAADMLNCSYDKFIRTTDEEHVRLVKKIFKKFYDQGDIYKSEYEGWYCVPCESFFTESQLDENGCCPDCGRPVKKTKEEAYFFKISKYQQRLMDYIDQHPDFIAPVARKNEMVNNFLKPGVQDLCVSRTSFTWGIGVDFDPKHVVYVWLDALVNYISALGYDPDGSSELFTKYWPCDVHIIGKDILRFHTIYWPCFLMALDLPLPKQIFGHPWLLAGEDKMSKSKGNVMYADDLVNMFGVDAIRFYLLSEMPYAQDGTISYETIIARYNSELANTLGNLVNRTISMNAKYFNGVVQPPCCKDEIDQALIQSASDTFKNVEEKMEQFKVSAALDDIFTFARKCNKYIDETMPWALAKEEEKQQRLGTVLYNLLEAIRQIAVLLSPFIPATSKEIFSQLNCSLNTVESLQGFAGLQPGSVLGTPSPLFVRIDEKAKMDEISALIEKNAPKIQKKDTKATVQQVSIEDFSKISLIIAEILHCEAVEKSDKLYKIMVNDGSGQRQIVSGIAKDYTPQELLGKKVIIVSNLKPAKLRGVESQGMLLAADLPDGHCKVLFADNSLLPGTKIR